MPLPRRLARFNLLVTNRVLGPFARHAPGFAVVLHVGRRSGRTYRTPVSLFSEVREGRIYFFADVPKSAPTIRALLAIFTQALNGEPPETVLAIPSDYVSRLMRKVGLMTRERGLNAMLARMKRHAAEALAA